MSDAPEELLASWDGEPALADYPSEEYCTRREEQILYALRLVNHDSLLKVYLPQGADLSIEGDHARHSAAGADHVGCDLPSTLSIGAGDDVLVDPVGDLLDAAAESVSSVQSTASIADLIGVDLSFMQSAGGGEVFQANMGHSSGTNAGVSASGPEETPELSWHGVRNSPFCNICRGRTTLAVQCSSYHCGKSVCAKCCTMLEMVVPDFQQAGKCAHCRRMCNLVFWRTANCETDKKLKAVKKSRR